MLNDTDFILLQGALAHQAAYLPLAAAMHPSSGQSQQHPPLSRAVGQSRAPRPLGWAMAQPRAQASPLGPAAVPLLAHRAAPRLALALHQPLRRARLLPPAAQASRLAAPLHWHLALGAPQLTGAPALLRLPLARHNRLQARACLMLSVFQFSEAVQQICSGEVGTLAQYGIETLHLEPLCVAGLFRFCCRGHFWNKCSSNCAAASLEFCFWRITAGPSGRTRPSLWSSAGRLWCGLHTSVRVRPSVWGILRRCASLWGHASLWSAGSAGVWGAVSAGLWSSVGARLWRSSCSCPCLRLCFWRYC